MSRYTVFARQRGLKGSYHKWTPWDRIAVVEAASDPVGAVCGALLLHREPGRVQVSFVINECDKTDEHCTVYVFCDRTRKITYYRLDNPYEQQQTG